VLYTIHIVAKQLYRDKQENIVSMKSNNAVTTKKTIVSLFS